MLRWARPDAERIAAGAPAERETAQDAISMLLAEKARDGHVVARLKWGDPFVFDSGAKEALFLHEQGVPFEVVPGVPAAVGATAYAGVPITYPGAGDAIVFLRGHEGEIDSTPDVDWNALARLDGTLVCYAGARLVPRVLHGASRERIAARSVGCADLPRHAARHNARSPARSPTSWRRPRTTRSAERSPPSWWSATSPACGITCAGSTSGRCSAAASSSRDRRNRREELVDALENLGAQAIVAPTFRLAPPEDPEAVDRAAASVDKYHWVVFESATSVTRLLCGARRGPQRSARARAA